MSDCGNWRPRSGTSKVAAGRRRPRPRPEPGSPAAGRPDGGGRGGGDHGGRHGRMAAPAHAPSGERPSSSPGIDCVLALPASPAEVRVRVLDGGAPAGLPTRRLLQLRARDFTVLDAAAGPQPGGCGRPALRPGRDRCGDLAASGADRRGRDALRSGRRDETIDLTVGPTLKRLATPTEVNQILLVVKPSPPPDCSTTR